jgi:hypothetical protein
MVQKNYYSQDLADIVNAAMSKLGIKSNEQGGKACGISQECFRLTRGGKIPSEDVLIKMAEGLEIDLKKLRVAAGYEKPDSVAETVMLALRGTNKIPEEGKRQVIDFVKRMEEKYKDQGQG